MTTAGEEDVAAAPLAPQGTTGRAPIIGPRCRSRFNWACVELLPRLTSDRTLYFGSEQAFARRGVPQGVVEPAGGRATFATRKAQGVNAASGSLKHVQNWLMLKDPKI